MADPGSNTRTSVSIRCACVSNCPRIAGRPTWTGSTSGCASARPGRTRFIPRRCWPRPHPGRHRYLPARPRAGAAYAVRARPDHRRRPRARASVAPPRRGVRIGRPGHILTIFQFPPRPLCPFRLALEKPLPCNALTASRLKWTRWEPTSHLAPAPTRPTAPRRSATPAYFSNDSWMLAVARFLQAHASRCALGVSFQAVFTPSLASPRAVSRGPACLFLSLFQGLATPRRPTPVCPEGGPPLHEDGHQIGGCLLAEVVDA